MNQQLLNDWLKLYNQYKDGYHLSDSDWSELLQMNHLILEATHEVHNHNMTERNK